MSCPAHHDDWVCPGCGYHHNCAEHQWNHDGVDEPSTTQLTLVEA